MSLYTDPYAIVVTDGGSSLDSSEAGLPATSYAYGGPRRYGDGYTDDEVDLYGHSSDDNSSVDDLVRRTLRQQYTDLERDLGAAAGLDGTPFRNRRRHRSARRGPYSGTEGILVDQGSSDDDDDEDGETAAARDVARLQRLHRGLMAMRMKEKPSFDDDDHGGADRGTPQRARQKPKRVVDPETFKRLTKPNASAAAKMQEKYEKRAEREENEKKKGPPRVSPIATKAGQRLYLGARAQQREAERLREEQAAAAAKEEGQYTFQPRITPMAQRLAAQGYRTLEERTEEHRLHQEELERRRIELQVEDMRRHPFRPTLSRGTNEIVEARRSRSRRHRRSRSRSHSSPRCVTDDAAERLYREGGERLLRQQVRQRLAEQRHEKRLIGNNVCLTRDRQEEVNGRLEEWQRTRERNIAALREEAERMRRAKQVGHSAAPASAAAAVERLLQPKEERGSSSRASSSTAATRTGPLPQNAEAARRPARSKPTSPQPAPLQGAAAQRRAPSAASSAAPTTAAAVAAASADPFAGLTPQQRGLYWEMRRIRFGALFYKFTAGSGSDVVTLEQVERVVAGVYREDWGVAQALRDSVGNTPQICLSKERFIALLVGYEEANGPQPWARTEKDALLFPMLASLGQQEKVQPGEQRGVARGGGGDGSSSSPSGSEVEPQPVPPSPEAAPPVPSPAAAAKRQRVPRATRGIATQTDHRHPRRGPQTAAVHAFGRSLSAAAPATRPQIVTAAPGAVAAGPRTQSRSSAAKASGKEAKYSRTASAPAYPFAPTISKASARLSSIELERRVGYAREMVLRKQELGLLQVKNKTESASTAAGRRTASTAKATAPLSQQHQQQKPQQTRGAGTAVGGNATAGLAAAAAAAAEALNPSVELSSLTSSVSQSPISPFTPPQQQRQPPAQNTSAAIANLQALLDAADDRGTAIARPTATAVAPPPPPPTLPRPSPAPTRTGGTANYAQTTQQQQPPRQSAQGPLAGMPGKPPRSQESVPLSKPKATASARAAPPPAPSRGSAPAGGTATAEFSEESFDVLFDAMYRKEKQQHWF